MTDALLLILAIGVLLTLVVVLVVVAIRLSLGLITKISEAWYAGKPITLSQLEARKELIRLETEATLNAESRRRAEQQAARASTAGAAHEKVGKGKLETELVAYESYTPEQLKNELTRVENRALPVSGRDARLAKLRSLL